VPRALQGLPPTFRWLLAGSFASALATFVFPFLALFLTSRGFSVTEASLVVGAFGAGSVLSGPLAGSCTDRLGRRPTLMASLFATAALTALLGAVQAPAALILTAGALGVVASAYRPAANAVVADVVAPDQMARAYGLLYWAFNVGIAISFAAGGLLVGLVGYGPLFAADAATTFVFALMVTARIPETRPAPPVARGHAAIRLGYRQPLTDPHFLVLLALLLLTLLPFLQFMVAVPVVMTRQGHSPAAFGWVMATNGMLIALLQPTLTRWAGRFDSGRVLALSAVLIGIGNGAYALATSAWTWAVATGLWTLGEILVFPSVDALVARLAPVDLRGRYQGVLSFLYGVGLAAAPPLGGLALERFGPTALFGGSLVIGLLVAAGHLAAAAPRRRRLAAIQQVTRSWSG
jgi:MFS family permease